MGNSADYVVVGSGLAGLYFAAKAARRGCSVLAITKAAAEESNTTYAQGGIAAVVDPGDSLDSHIEDTLTAGDGLSDRQAVAAIVGRGPGLVAELETLGVHFTRDSDGRLSLGREGGHSASRVVRADDLTGREVSRALLAVVRTCPSVELRANHMALDLVLDARGACTGVRVLDMANDQIVELSGSAVLLATGGCGRIFRHTTNPPVATGDGLALAWRAGGRLGNLEFVQFHPTVLYRPGVDAFLISEAVRGYGGVLVNHRGERFVDARHPLGSLATRDVLSRAIVDELQASGRECVYLDVTAKDPETTRRRFPNIFAHCLEAGIDMTRQPIPVVPAAHYMCGGVWTDLQGRTSVPGLYAAGEMAMTGLHGANRLASNSLLEALVMADEVAAAVPPPGPQVGPTPLAVPAARGDGAPTPETLGALRARLQQIMWDDVGIVRCDAGLERAARELATLGVQVESLHAGCPYHPGLCELRNMLTVAGLVADGARQRRESRGGHYNSDHPVRDDAHWQRPLFQQRRAAGA